MRCRRKPFYPNVALGQGVVFFGALTVSAANYSDTSSVLFSRPLPSLLQELRGGAAANCTRELWRARRAIERDPRFETLRPPTSGPFFVIWRR